MISSVPDNPLQLIVLVSNIENERLLAGLFGEHYQVTTTLTSEREATWDVCIVDASSFAKHRATIELQRGPHGQTPAAAVVGLLPPTETREAVVAQFDEVIRLPSTHAEITRRIRALMSARILAVQNENLRRELMARVKTLEHLTRRAEEASSVKSSFLANMSHEIRTPLNAILGFGDLLAGSDLPAHERDYLSVIRRNGRALAVLIDDILDLSKVEAGMLDIELRPVSLTDLVDDVAALFADRASAKGVRLSRVIEGEIPPFVTSDPARLRQILVNVVGNAIKFTDRGTVRVTVRAAPCVRGQVPVTIAVADSGIGITDQQRARLFEPFVQAEESTARRFGGTGLGLALSRRLARALGGDLSIASTIPNEGTTFELKFNAGQVGPERPMPLVNARDLVPHSAGSSRTIRVLLVDDCEDNRYLMELVLRKAGFAVETARDGREAVDLALAGGFDVVLMDIQMPVMDGYEALGELLRRGYDKPVLALTAHAMIEERARTRNAGFAAHLNKPIEPEVMFNTLRGILNRRDLSG